MAFPITHADGETWDGAAVTDLEQRAWQEMAQLGPSNGTDDAADINNTLVNGGIIRGKPGQTYLISTPLVIPSDTRLDMTCCTIAYAAGIGAVFNMVQNKAVQPVVTANDVATTANTAVITSTTLAAAAVVGQQVAIVGAGPVGGNGGGPIWLYGTVLSINAGAHQIMLTSNNVNGIAATNTLTGATGYLFNRDSNIEVVGGIWDGGTAYGIGGVGNANWHSFNSHQLRFRRVDGLTVRDLTVKLSGFPAGGGWVFGINPGDCTDYLVENITAQGASTTVEADGPCYRGIIRNIRGTTQDDMVAFGTVGFQGNDVEGDIIDLQVDGIESNGSYTAFKLFGGTGSNGALRIIDDVTVRSVKGTTQQTSVQVIDYIGTNTISADFDDISVYPSPIGGFSQIYLASQGAQVINLANLRWPLRAGTPVNGVIVTGRPVAHLTVRGWEIRGTGTGSGYGLSLADGAGTGVGAYNIVDVSGVRMPDAAHQCYLIAAATSRPIDRLSVHDFRKQGPLYVVYENGYASIEEVAITDGRTDNGSYTNLFCNTIASTSGLVLHVSNVHVKQTNLAGTLAYTQRPITILADNVTLDQASAAVNLVGTNATPARILGRNLRFPGASSALFARDGAQAMSADSSQGTVDLATITTNASDGDIAYNSNGSLSCGAGLCTYHTGGTGNGWKNLYSGSTY